MKRRTYYASPEDEQAIATLMHRYGLSTESDVIRFALRVLAEPESIRVNVNKRVIEKHKKGIRG